MKVYRLDKKVKPSSQQWLRRHLSDPYVQKAAKEGFRCRSAYKLEEMHQRFSLFYPGIAVLDLGCAPGGWCQVVQRCLRDSEGKISSTIMGIDRLAMEPLEGVSFLQGDILDESVQKQFLSLRFHGVLSDMAPSQTGHRDTDRMQMEVLVQEAWQVVHQCLQMGGFLVMKIFHGEMTKNLAPLFGSVHLVKPKASRPASKEIYLVACNYKGRP